MTELRKNGINDKQVFFCRRYAEPELGSYFEYRIHKEVCNPDDKHPSYIKIGGVVFLPKKAVPGKKIWSSAERIKESQYFGSYVYFGDTDRKLRTILYARRKCLPDDKLVSRPGILHSIIPRYDGKDKKLLITGMKITDRYESDRRWCKYDSRALDHPGFFELKNNDDLRALKDENVNDGFGEQRRYNLGIYVGANTSVLMVDTTRAHLYNDFCRQYVYTLFQSGAFICNSTTFWFNFYDEEEAEDYTVRRLLDEKADKLNESPNLKLLDISDTPLEDKSRIVFLKSGANYTFWTFRITRFWKGGENELQICFPTGGQFENVMRWDDGIEEVIRRQALNPWNKYIEREEPDGSAKVKSVLTNISLYKDEAYPQ